MNTVNPFAALMAHFFHNYLIRTNFTIAFLIFYKIVKTNKDCVLSALHHQYILISQQILFADFFSGQELIIFV